MGADINHTSEGWARRFREKPAVWKAFGAFCGEVLCKKVEFERRWEQVGKPERQEELESILNAVWPPEEEGSVNTGGRPLLGV